MLNDAELEEISPAELIALARLAVNSEFLPPPHLRHDLAERGWVTTTEDGQHSLTGLGQEVLQFA